MIASAIFSKLFVDKAKIVGPAPLRQTPRSPGYEAGTIRSRISPSPGIKC